jgi:hypothetical protein
LDKSSYTGKTLFQTTSALADSDALYEDDGVAVDLSKYSREEREAERRREEEELERQVQSLYTGGDESD